jgi:hypothetical protein
MLKRSISSTNTLNIPRRLHSSLSHESHARPFQFVDTIKGHFEAVDIKEFRQRAYFPEIPILITPQPSNQLDTGRNIQPGYGFPAAEKWFTLGACAYGDTKGDKTAQALIPSFEYLSTFGTAVLPYELITDNAKKAVDSSGQNRNHQLIAQLLEHAPNQTFHRFNAPLSLFLEACKSTSPPSKLYIAQAQINTLPKQLQDDLPTPRIVKAAGKGDLYDANIWLGTPPTYTPLHKDPNPNLFVQLASNKCVRLFPPYVGRTIFYDVQQKIGQRTSASFRGNEMMEGPEREALHEAVWGDSVLQNGFEALVKPGDALFIPKGWWHSIKSVGPHVTASVNWWFR